MSFQRFPELSFSVKIYIHAVFDVNDNDITAKFSNIGNNNDDIKEAELTQPVRTES